MMDEDIIEKIEELMPLLMEYRDEMSEDLKAQLKGLENTIKMLLVLQEDD